MRSFGSKVHKSKSSFEETSSWQREKLVILMLQLNDLKIKNKSRIEMIVN